MVYRLSSPVYEERLGIVDFPTVRGGGDDSDEMQARGETAGDVRSVDTVLLVIMVVAELVMRSW